MGVGVLDFCLFVVKIVAYLSFSAVRTHFARTKIPKIVDHLSCSLVARTSLGPFQEAVRTEEIQEAMRAEEYLK